MLMNWEHIAAQIADKGYFVTDSFFESHGELKSELLHLDSIPGICKPAGIGTKGELQTSIRSDRIAWWQSPPTSIQERYLERIQILTHELNSRLFLGIFDSEFHYAIYEAGGHYAKHLDRFQSSPQGGDRVLSLVYYLNEDWTLEDEGQLVLYQKDDSGNIETSISPSAGRLVGFLSDLLYHEVISPRRTRLSVTGWLRNRRVGASAKVDF
ncbi:MAG: 2OG-Fe(II) oxygenase [Pseudobdellovibrionaceae bacterium]